MDIGVPLVDKHSTRLIQFLSRNPCPLDYVGNIDGSWSQCNISVLTFLFGSVGLVLAPKAALRVVQVSQGLLRAGSRPFNGRMRIHALLLGLVILRLLRKNWRKKSRLVGKMGEKP